MISAEGMNIVKHLNFSMIIKNFNRFERSNIIHDEIGKHNFIYPSIHMKIIK